MTDLQVLGIAIISASLGVLIGATIAYYTAIKDRDTRR